MFLSKKSFVIVSVLIVFLAVAIWPRNIPEKMENPETVRKVFPISKLLTYVSLTIHRMKFENPFVFHQKFLEFISHMGLYFNPPSLESVTMQERHFQGVRTLVFQPKTLKNQAAVLFFHGGGYVFGSPEQYRKLTIALAEELGCVVISVDYRLAPEHIHPAWQEDVHKVTKFFLEQGHKEFNVDPKKVFLMGDSAGGHIVATLGLQFPSVRAIVLMYPVTQYLTYNTPSYDEIKIFLLREQVTMFSLLYFQGNAQDDFQGVLASNHSGMALRLEYANKFGLPELVHKRSRDLNGKGDPQLIQRLKHMYEDPLNSPLFGDLRQFPPSLFITCQFDVLRDDSLMMIRRLKKAQRVVKHMHVNTFHGFMTFVQQYPPARRGLGEITAFLKSYL